MASRRYARFLLLIPTVTLTMTLLGSCSRATAPEIDPTIATAADNPPIWQVTGSPLPVGIVRLNPGESAEIFLDRHLADPLAAIESHHTGNLPITATISGKYLVLSAGDNFESTRGFVRVLTRHASGKRTTIDIPVVLEPTPVIEFTYRPSAGDTVNSVFVAGEFNGWSGAANPLAKQPDGSFAASVAIEPGDYSYKFVVDGEWISDPANPRQDSSGYGNSLLNVPGKRAEDLEFATLNNWMPGAGPQGGVRLVGPPGAKLDPASVKLALNNSLLDDNSYSINASTGVIALNVPASEWRAENHLVILAADTTGRTGEFQAPFDLDPAARTPRDEVMYFAMTDRFFDGAPSLNDPPSNPELHPLANYHGGDWAGIRRKIEEGYFDRLGITTIWISPVNKNTSKVERDAVPPHRLFSSYHGYWPVSLTETNPQFGSMEDLRALVDTAHEHGIAVLLDFVANHVHEDHPLIQEHPEWIVPLELPDGRQNIRLFDEHPLTTWFDAFLPTLRYEDNPELVAIMADNAMWWLDQTGADGFRHDAVKHIPVPFWQALTERIRAESRESGRRYFQIGETISDRGTINRFVGPGMLDGQFDFPLLWPIQGTIARGHGSMKELGTAIVESTQQYPAGAVMSPLVGNHDVARFMAFADGDFPIEGMGEKEVGYTRPPAVDDPTSYDKIELAFATLMALPGAPAIYYGDEIGLTGAHDPDNRRDLIWDGRNAEQERVFQTTASLIGARKASAALRRGDLKLIKATDEQLVFIRTTPGETVLVALVRQPAQGLEIDIPAWWGTDVAFEAIMTKNAQIASKNGLLALSGGPHSFGFWRVQAGN